MRVLICGSRHWNNRCLIHRHLSALPAGTVIIHGAAPGADTQAGEVAKELGFEVLVFPANWELYGRAAGPIRNKQMLTEGKPDVVVAFHNDLENSRGTKNMVRQAKEAKVPVLVQREGVEVT